MLEATFSPLVPTNKSERFYIEFYNQFCFIQVNDAFIMLMKERLTKEDTEGLLSMLNNFHEDQDIAAVYSIGAGIMNGTLMRRRKENRGVSIELFNSLRSENIDPLGWYERAFEFLMVYATCEQAVKEYLVSKGILNTLIKEDTLLNCLFTELQNSELRNNFITELKNGSASVIKSQNQLISAWKYYTLFRHTLIHAGGRTTDKMKTKMEQVIDKNRKELDSINNAMLVELQDTEVFFTSPFEGTVIDISDNHLNFFRNMAILIVESLERAIHPDEYEIKDFDPYKLMD